MKTRYSAIPPASNHASVRVGIACSRSTDHTFYSSILESIDECGHASIVAKIELQTEQQDYEHITTNRSFLARWFERFDRFYKATLIAAHRETCAQVLRDIPNVEHDRAGALTEVTRKQLADLDLDLIIQCDRDVCVKLAAFAKFGIWTFEFLNRAGATQTKSALYRALDTELISRIGLFANAGTCSKPLLLGRTVARKQQALSLVSIMEAEGNAASVLLIWELWKLNRPGAKTTPHHAMASRKPSTHSPIDSVESSTKLARQISGRLSSKLLRAIKSAKPREWRIGLRAASDDEPWASSWNGFTWIDAREGHYLADPFLFRHQQNYWLFAEDYISEAQKGVLNCAPVSDDGVVGQWTTILEFPYHLSFPLVFENDGEIFMVPESSAGGSVELYRANEFPYAWSKVRTLWAGPGLDTVPFRAADGIWYFFTSVQSHKDAPPQLLLFTAKELHAEWQLHPANPLSLDVRYSRNGGRILEMPTDNGTSMLVRVSQDGSGNYGSKLHFHQIELLTPENYRERLISSRYPPAENDGSHHYDRCDRWEVMDIS